MIYLTQSVHRNCQKFPNQVMSDFNGRAKTWTQYKDRIGRFAGALQRLGMAANDRVAILALNSDRYLEFYNAVPWGGGAVVPLNTRWSVKENAYSLKDSGTKILLVDDAFLPQVEGLKKEDISVETYIYIGEKDCQTELSPLATINPLKFHVLEGPSAGKIKSAGRAGACVEIRIVDKDDKVLGPGGIGEVTVMGPNKMLRYWNKPEETATSLRNGWIYTGDVGYMDEDGFLYLVDRAKDMIISGGENVYSSEVENAVQPLLLENFL